MDLPGLAVDAADDVYTRLLDRFVTACRDDDRIVAAFLVGSRASGSADSHSDIDLHVVTHDDAYDDFLASCDAFAQLLGEPLLNESFDLPHMRFLIYADGAEVELMVQGLGSLRIIGPYRLLLDKTGTAEAIAAREVPPPAVDTDDLARRLPAFWHDVGHFATALERGHLVWAAGQLDDLRRLCLDLAMILHEPPIEAEGYWKADAVLDPELLDEVRATIVPPTADELRAAGRSILELYRHLAHQAASRHGLAYPERLDRVVSSRLG
jgi:predicted nucleotidyltransferase